MQEGAHQDRTGEIGVIFTATRTAADDAGYAEAAAAMDRLAAAQPGYRGMDSTRDASGFGITVSWWAEEAAAIAWHNHPVHAAVRDRGRMCWYSAYEVAGATVERSCE